jgi:NAD(P)-dependent dehydrogenase (short-subunit alcohol dehydrogenase family)
LRLELRFEQKDALRASRSARRFEGKTMMTQRRAALVTGSSRGIGKAVALALACTHDIVLNYRARRDEADAAAEIFRAAGAGVLLVQADITEPNSLIRLADAGLKQFGRIDTLVTNAATGLHWPVSVSGWQQIADSVQVIAGSFATLVAQLSPAMVEGGRIVAISGLDRMFAVADHGLIGAGKAAVESMVRNLAMELGPRGITANAVVPGACRTESLARALERRPGFEADLVKTIPVGRMAAPEDVAGVVAFLCSSAANYVTGTSILVDGGFSAGNLWTDRQRISLAQGGWSDRKLGQ